eukprot:gnl/TRDRNA2_/TRDRNA2_198065_c0_seq1.p1 gnl/TRDRNA2_/TRDRNA2_198065_c0~~gnl/TRDRNA2_/TRDRNA2_198065_c0_seq1.p1  ORF type:complete len:166 (-),score=19.14 gnl/TRDRNA2_/TRDRNA2_198065_c0_seq1:223-690(-)
MGNSHPVRDAFGTASPWQTRIRIENKTTRPVLMFLARDATRPSAANAIAYTLPSDTSSAIISGWLQEPRATLLFRTGSRSAKVMRATHGARIIVDVTPEGLSVESPDDVLFEDFADALSVPGLETVPMLLRGDSFANPVAESPATPATRDVNEEA